MTFTPEEQEQFVRLAMREVDKSIARGDGPFGAVLVNAQGQVAARAHNTQNTDADESAHAEINLLRSVGQRKLPGLAVFTNASPCSMCSSALIKAGVRDFYYGASPEGSMQPDLPLEEVARHCQDDIRITGGILAEECRAQVARGRGVQERAGT